MTLIKIKTIKQLKDLTKLTFIDGFIFLVGSVKSSKRIYYDEDKSIFHIYNEIDGTLQKLTEEQLIDSSCSHIGLAIDKGILFLKTIKPKRHGLGYNI